MSKKYPEHKNVELSQVSTEILDFWKKNSIFEKSISSREGQPSFTFFEGPPSANGTPGIHHVMARTVKDIFCRYKTLKGFQVKRKGGWDTHGLPVELQVEKELGITKDDIGKKISVEEYNQKCREAVMKYKSQWDDLTEKMGYWVDLEHPYITFENDYIETCWYLLKQLYEKGLLYKGYTIQPYSPAAGTGLSSHELNQPGCYRDVKDTTVVAQFKAVDFNSPQEGKVYFLAWTTTPWTLPSNAALAVGEKIEYALVKTLNPYTHQPVQVILAKALLGKYFQEKGKDGDFDSYRAGDKVIPWTVVAEYKGAELVGKKYEQLLPYVQPEAPAFRVIPGDFVSTEDGTGIVHIAPTFGADDARVAKAAGIPAILVDGEPLVDKRGRFLPQVQDEVFGLGGEFVKEEYLSDAEKAEALELQKEKLAGIIAKLDKYMSVDERIALKLKLGNQAFKVEKYEHSYPHCWRTDKPVLYYPLDSWFIRTTALKGRMSELNKTINWKPESTGTGRFGHWLENLVDWNLSRSRYWGTPLPIWRTEDASEERCIGSVSELKEEIKKSLALLDSFDLPAERKAQAREYMSEALKKGIHDLHRPYVDYIILVSPDGKPMFRESDLIDVWFDSGAMPYAQWHYMGDSKALPFNGGNTPAFPADFISEGVDQTRGWFFTLHALSTLLFDSVAFKNVVSTGLVLDKNGVKMSKRLGNVINPFETIGQYGPDATRWYMIGNAPPWDNLKFNLDGVTEVLRRFFGTLQNTYSFFALYANLDGFTYAEKDVPLEKRTESDRWILSRLHSLIQLTDKAYADYDATVAVRAIESFVCDDLSNWYVRLNRKRFWKGEYSSDKMAAYQTLYTCLETVAKLASPVAPFYTERLFQDLNGVSKKDRSASIHLADMPVADTRCIDTDLEQRMAYAQQLTSLIHSLRKGNSLRVRQPLSKMLVPVLNENFRKQIAAVQDLILSEVNIKVLEFVDDSSGILVKKVKPNFKKLGKEYGAKLKEVGAIIQAFTQADILTLEREGRFQTKLSDGTPVSLSPEDVEISFEDIPGWLVASAGSLTVALDITLTEELKQEGVARDFVNRIQNLRKDMGLEVQDKIELQVVRHSESVSQALIQHQAYICAEVQALSLELVNDSRTADLIEMEDFQLAVDVQVIKTAPAPGKKSVTKKESSLATKKSKAKTPSKSKYKTASSSQKKTVKKATKSASKAGSVTKKKTEAKKKTAVKKASVAKKQAAKPIKKAGKKTQVEKGKKKIASPVKKKSTKKVVAKKSTTKKVAAKKVRTKKATTVKKKSNTKTVSKKAVARTTVKKSTKKKTAKKVN
ncbi:MAG: isoleucine--tRNA ligase [Cytophagaceae bacterium]|nr:isoleucine--tRNA ligase [Cytophagaceae bacterium]